MTFIMDIFQYMVENYQELLIQTIDHILMVGYGLGLALIVGIPLGIIAAKVEKLAPVIISIANIVQLIPSLAMLAILMLYMGFGFNTIVVGLFLYSLLPIIKNTYVGIKEVKQSVIESGIGNGMTTFQLLWKIQFPLSIPFLLAGVRLAAVIAISVATLGPYVGAGGLGKVIISGISLQSDVKIYTGAIISTLLALIVDFIFGKVESKTKGRLT